VKIVAAGTLNPAEAGERRSCSLYPTVTPIGNGTLLATYTVGSTKDSEDNTIELRWSSDNGGTWSAPRAPFETTIDGRKGSLLAGYITPLSFTHLLIVAAWVDRQAHPGKPLFNAETEGILPMKAVLADSHDCGQTWRRWRVLPLPAELGPAAVTGPIIRLSEGKLVLSLENGKSYEDVSRWYQKVWFCYSGDQGRTWTTPAIGCEDPSGRIFNWDQKAGLAPDGRLVTFTWTYDREVRRYLNIHRRISPDGGRTWTDPEDLGIADQPAHPAVLSDGRVVLAWVDRFKSRTIRARFSESIDAPFLPETEVTLYEHHKNQEIAETYQATGELLAELSSWDFGHPHAEALPNGDVIVVFYAGTNPLLNAQWVRLRL